MSAGFRRLLTLTVSTKRATVNVGTGKKSTPSTHLSGLKATPLDPADADLVLRTTAMTGGQFGAGGVSPASQFLQTYVEGDNDIVHGDVLNVTSVDRGIATPYTVVGHDYPIVGIEPFQWRGTAYHLLVVQYIVEAVA